MSGGRWVRSVRVDRSIEEEDAYFARLPVVQSLIAQGSLSLEAPVTFLVGENGTGKSTLLEAIAVCCGFNPEGGTVNFNFSTRESHSGLCDHLRVGRGGHRPRDGFFLRAESYFNVATEIERLDLDLETSALPATPLIEYYGHRSLHEQSHGESFMALVLNRFGGNGLYILDEPEAALSPGRQMALLAAIRALVEKNSQFLISTHSPILMACPGAVVYELTEGGIAPTPYDQTEHYTLTREFLNAPERMLRYLLAEEDTGE